ERHMLCARGVGVAFYRKFSGLFQVMVPCSRAAFFRRLGFSFRPPRMARGVERRTAHHSVPPCGGGVALGPLADRRSTAAFAGARVEPAPSVPGRAFWVGA